MLLQDRVYIAAPPEEVWRYVESPDLAREWNGAIKALVPVSRGERKEGFRYRLRYETAMGEGNFLAEIMEYERPVRLVIHLTGGSFPRKGYALDIYELSTEGAGVLLRRRIEFHATGTNAISRGLAVLKHRFFRPKSRKYLLRLKDLLEDKAEYAGIRQR